jgi:hypothetical protein
MDCGHIAPRSIAPRLIALKDTSTHLKIQSGAQHQLAWVGVAERASVLTTAPHNNDHQRVSDLNMKP